MIGLGSDKNKFQHTKSDSEIRGFQQINVSSEISKSSFTSDSISVTLEPNTDYCPNSIIRARASANNSRIYAGTNFLPAIL